MYPRIFPLAMLALLGQLPASGARATGEYRESLTVNGTVRHYKLRVPPGVRRSGPRPLVVLLHGWTSSADLIEEATGFGEKADREGFVLAVPEGLGSPQGWNAGFFDLTGAHHPDDVGFIGRLIDQVESEASIDRDRVYVVGHSNGAMMANLVGSRLGSRLAAIGVVSGTIGVRNGSGGPRIIPEPPTPVSVIVVHGRRDGMVAYDRTSQALFAGIGAPESAAWWAQHDGCRPTPSETVSPNGNVKIDVFSGGRRGTEVELMSIKNGVHDWPGGLTLNGRERETGVNATDVIWSFFLAHRRNSG